MEFWGIEVKSGQTQKVTPDLGKLIHISQAAIGEVKDIKGSKSVHIRMKIDDKKFVIGTLSVEDRPQIMFDLVFEKEFELSHDLKNGSVYFMGYIADDPVSDGEVYSDFDDSEDEEELPIEAKENGSVKPKAEVAKPAAKAIAKKEEKAEKKENSDDDDEEDDSDFGSDDEMAIDGLQDASDDSDDDSDEDDEDDSSEEEELPKPAATQSKKRPVPSAEKTPAAKKAKSSTPAKSGKKGQASTPPKKSAGKTPNKKEQTPKSCAQLTCKSCPKTFSSGSALESHSKAKHGGK